MQSGAKISGTDDGVRRFELANAILMNDMRAKKPSSALDGS
jgi:hypothetical protein